MKLKVLLTGIVSLSLAITVWAAPGPPPSNKVGQPDRPESPQVSTKTKLNVIIPVFDPNPPADPDDYEKEGVWPELRNAESVRFAMALRDTMAAAGVFGDVRVTPNDYAMGELYVYGKILKSTSEMVAIEIRAVDITNKQWLRKKKFKYRVREYNLTSQRTKGQEPYQPVFDAITQALVKELAKKKEKVLTNIVQVGNLVNAASYSEDEFSRFLKRPKQGSIRLKGYPSDGHAGFARTRELRVQEELFGAQIQKEYVRFVTRSQQAYSAWQTDSFPEAKEYRLAREKANKQLAGGILAAVAGAALAKEADDLDSTGDKVRGGAAVASAILATGLIYKSFKTRKESRMHVERLNELGRTMDSGMAATNVQVEGQVIEVEGDAAEQMQTWRRKLQEWYEQNRTPNIQL